MAVVDPPGGRPEPLPVRAPRPLLPPAVGLGGHVRYSFAAIRFLLAWRRRLRELDEDLSRNARERDLLLGALGEAARSALIEDARVAAFGATASVLEEERAAVDRERESGQSELDRTRADLRRDVQALEAQIAEAQRLLSPHAAERIRTEGRHEELVRLREAAVQRVRALRDARNQAAAPEDAARLAAEAQTASAEVERLDAALDAAEAALAAAETEIARHRHHLEALRRRLDDVRRAGEGHIAELEAAVRRLTTRAEAVVARRRATLVDLGHELAREPSPRPGLADAWRAARTGLERYEHCRTTRELVYAEGSAFDRKPLRRTLLAAGALVGALIVAASTL